MGNSTRDIPQDDWDDYLLAIGGFVISFAMAEDFLRSLLRAETGVDDLMARAIFSGVRVDQAKTFIKRARQVNDKAENELLNRVFEQLTVITNVRNDLLHLGPVAFDSTEPRNLAGTLSNEGVGMPGRHYRYGVTTKDLSAMIHDLQTICLVLTYLGLTASDRENNSEAVSELISQLEKATSAPWRYKSQTRVRIRPPSR